MTVPFVLLPPGTFDDVAVGDRVRLPDGVRHHLTRVLRLDEGATVEAADGAGVEATTRLRGDALVVSVPPALRPEFRPQLQVLQALGKGRKHDEVVRVLTELGVEHVTAVGSARTVVELDEEKATKVRQRWLNVATAACEQARRATLPTIDGPTSLAAALEDVGSAPVLAAQVGAGIDPIEAAAALGEQSRIVLAVGPEGGWSSEELALLEEVGATFVGLGPTVLRTEHAAPVLAAVVAAATGRMRPTR